MLAFTDGIAADPAFDAAEAQLCEMVKPSLVKLMLTYERETGDIEGAERIGNLTGWRGYYYKKS